VLLVATLAAALLVGGDAWAAIKPANTSLPTISGTAATGQVLTADPGTWSGTTPISYAYQWKDCDSAGNNCVSIANNSKSQTYTQVESDIGHTIRVKVTASNGAGSSSATSDQTAVVQNVPFAPVNLSPPSISGTAQDGQTLTANKGTWSGTGTLTYTYRWQRCGSLTGCLDIMGATAKTYNVVPADVGSTLDVVVTSSNKVGWTAMTSAQTAVVQPAPPANTAAPTISGTAQDGQTLTADPGTWTGTPPIDLAYQWRRCDPTGGSCADVSGATGQTYPLSPADVGSAIEVAVTGSNASGASTATSSQTATVTGLAPTNTARPSISGTAQDGQTLTADPGTWTGTAPISYAYQWRRCDSAGGSCTDVAGATGSTYLLGPADVGSTIRVAVTASNVAGSATASSNATGAVSSSGGGEPANVSIPSISGTLTEGQTLTADPGSWSGAEPISYAYQWRRCEDDGDCGDILGATSASYTLTPAEADNSVAVVVTASNSAGSTTAASATTPAVRAVRPNNDGLPTIGGVAQKGQALTADPGTWSGTQPLSFAYQWQRCDAIGVNCVAISGATARSYTLTISDIGSAIRVNVTGSNSAGSSSALAVATAAVAGVYREDVMADTPVGYWRLGEATGTTAADETASNDPGTYLNAITLGAPGAIVGDANTAPSFDGVDDEVSMGNPASGILNFGTSSFTVEAWVKPTLKGSQLTTDQPLVAKQPSTTGKPAWELTFTTDSGFVGRVKAKLTDTSGVPMKAYSGVRIDDGKWHHVVATFDRANGITVYVDGVGTFTAGATPGDVSNNTALLIGQEGRMYPFFKGQIDEVALYKGLLPSARVKSHYENGAATQAIAPVSTAPPMIGGTAKKGYLLSAALGTWTGTQPISYAYQWQRCDSSGANCLNVQGATGQSYTAASADVGSTIRVTVTAVNAGGSTQASSPATAVVADASLDPVIAAAGDIACRSNPVTSGTSCHYGLTSNLILGDSRITDVLALGDDQYNCGDYPFYVKYFGPTWGSIKARFRPVPGNHEYVTYAPANQDGSQPPGTLSSCDLGTTVPAAGYFDYWNGIGVDSGPAGDRDKGYYSYDVGDWHLVALNGECYMIGGCDRGSPEETWLASDLASHPSSCTLAYWHEPRFSSGHVGNNEYVTELWQDLYAAGAEVVLNGHDHDYERFAAQTPTGAAAANGIREFVVGTGGASHGGYNTIQPNSEVRNADTYGVLKLTLHSSSYDWQFAPETPGGFSDSGSGSCH
jgi:hypothetical protein